MRILMKAIAAATLFAACVTTQPITAQSVKVVTVTVDSPTVALGHRAKATVRVRLANGRYDSTRTAVWGTSKPGVALVSTPVPCQPKSTILSCATISTITTGSTAIAAIVGGVKGEAVVTVVPVSSPAPPPAPAPVVSVTASLARNSMQVGAATQATAVPRDSAGDPLTGRDVGWSSTAPSIASVSPTGVVTALAQGSATIRATVEAKTADAPLTVTAAPTPPATDTTTTPRAPALLTTTVASTPSTGRSLTVASGGNLQTALDSARAGDRITVACATFFGNFVLPVKSTSSGVPGGWITVQSACATPAEGTRVSPADPFTTLVSRSALPVLTVAPGAQRWRLIGLELTADASVTAVNAVLELGDGQAATTAQLPRNIIVDRGYIHGLPPQWVHRCVSLNSDSTAILDSYISECHADIDAQAVWGWGGNGPYKIVNTYMEGSTETFGFGGADPRIANLVPSDIEVRGNHITRQMAWKGGPWLEKNLIEFKNARRVVIEGNVIENAWPHAQSGWAFVLWSVNQNGTCTWCIVSDITIQNNLIRNVSAGFQLSERYGDIPAPSMQRVAIRNNVVIGLANPLVGDGGYGFLIQGTLPSLTIEHNTMLHPSSPSLMWGSTVTGLTHHRVANNLTGGACGTYRQVSMQGAFTTLTDTSSRFQGNVVACYDDYVHYFPSGNFFPTSLAAIGFAGGAGAAYSVTATLDSLALTSGSPYHNAATDGTDIGADIAAVKAAIAGALPLGVRRALPIRKP